MHLTNTPYHHTPTKNIQKAYPMKAPYLHALYLPILFNPLTKPSTQHPLSTTHLFIHPTNTPSCRVHVDRVSKKKFVLRNHGCMPATCLFDMTGSDDFRFSSRNASLTLQPGQKGDLSVSFVPKVVEKSEAGQGQGQGDGVCEAVIRVSVLNNQFDQVRDLDP